MGKYREYAKRVRELVRRLYRENRLHEIRSELRVLANRFNMSEELEKQIKKVIELEIKKLMDEYKLQINPDASVLAFISEARDITERFNRRVFEIVRRAVILGEDDIKIENRIKRLSLVEERHISTISNTIQLGLARQSAMSVAVSHGNKYFRYMGPKENIRPFCREHLGGVYSIDEIRAMSNGQGLPVEYYCGGYNCRHRWVVFMGEVKNGVAVHESWQRVYERSNKQGKKVMQEERSIAERLSQYGKVELNYQKSRKQEGDTDIYFNGKPTQIKQISSTKDDALRERLHKSRSQADNFIFVIKNKLDDEEGAYKKAKIWLDAHSVKRLFILDISTNKFIKI